MVFFRRLLRWLLSLVETSATPELDAKIEENKKKIKEIDEEIKKDYDTVDSAKKEW